MENVKWMYFESAYHEGDEAFPFHGMVNWGGTVSRFNDIID